jgi:hypothetical protein
MIIVQKYSNYFLNRKCQQFLLYDSMNFRTLLHKKGQNGLRFSVLMQKKCDNYSLFFNIVSFKFVLHLNKLIQFILKSYLLTNKILQKKSEEKKQLQCHVMIIFFSEHFIKIYRSLLIIRREQNRSGQEAPG